MEHIKSGLPYPCTNCPKRETSECEEMNCHKWRMWFRSGVWKTVITGVIRADAILKGKIQGELPLPNAEKTNGEKAE